MSKRARNRAAVNRERARARREAGACAMETIDQFLAGIKSRGDFIIPLPETREEWIAQGFTFRLQPAVATRARLESDCPQFSGRFLGIEEAE
jgi:hypothetical protein